MLEDLKLGVAYDGFLFLAQSRFNPPVLRPHSHLELELNLVRRGSITYVTQGRRFTFTRGTLLWLFPAQEHQLVDRTADAENYVAVFKPLLIRRACRGERYGPLRGEHPPAPGILCTTLSPHDFDLVQREMDALLADGLDPGLLNREAGFGLSADFRFTHCDPDWLNAGLRHLLLLCWRLQQHGGSSQNPETLHPAVSRALVALQRQPETDLPTLSRQCGASPAYLSRLFHQQLGVPLSRYRNSVRLARFWKIFQDPSRQNLMQSALQSGFGSYAQFYRVFQETYGRRPGELRAGAWQGEKEGDREVEKRKAVRPV